LLGVTSPIFSKILYRKIDEYLSLYIKKCIIRIGERKIQMLKNKVMATLITLILVTSLAISIGSIQTASAYNTATQDAIDAGMHWDLTSNAPANRLLLWSRFGDNIPTWTFGIASPNPVGQGQTFNLIMMNPQVPPNSLLTNDIRYEFTVSILKPDGTTETLPAPGQTAGNVAGGSGGIANGVFVSDSTGSTYTAYTPDQIGNYSITVFFHELYYRWNSGVGGGSNDYYGTTFLASNYTLTVRVQQEPVSINGLPIIQPVPTEYWARPIEGQNDQWYTISSNWLCNAHDRDNGGAENRYQPDGVSPNSPHILWTRPTEDNGILGGTNDGRVGSGNAFNAGSQYQPRFETQIIMYGRLYYSPNLYTSGTSSLFDCVDLKTGELIYEQNSSTTETTFTFGSFTFTFTTTATPSFGYYYSQDDPNEHGIQNPGWLFSSNYGVGYQPERGLEQLHIVGVPNGFEVQGPAGENLRYVLGGNPANGYYLGQWNSSKVIPMINAGSSPPSSDINASTADRYDWNVSIGKLFTTTPTIGAVHDNDYVWGYNSSWPTGTGAPSYAYIDEVTVWAISIQPGHEGQLLYMKNLDVDDAETNQNILFERATGAEERFVGLEVPSCKFYIYDMTNGELVATTDAQADFLAYGYFTWPSLISQTQTKMAYGILYTGGYTGAVSAYSLANGSLLWRHVYPSGGEKIPNFVQMLGLINDGKIFVGTHEHSADTPLYKGERLHALNATTGEEVWDMSGWAYPKTFATADGVLIYWNNYDAQIYALGKGPTSMTVTAPDIAAALGSSVTIKGTVTDISAGTKQQQQAARFPNGVPVVSDEAQAQWMEYVYMQKGKPNNTTGVPVTISVVDANGNYREIGTATTEDGFYSLNWKPDIEGKYTVYASFAGSESYWPTHAMTAFSVDPAAPTPAPTEAPAQSTADLYFVPAIVGLFVAIIVVGLLIVLFLRKRP
jgi:hypothetical protein